MFNPFGTKQADAAWFNDNWGYRKRIDVTVTSSASDITDLDTLLTIDTTGITSKLQSACQDLRFTDVNGNVLSHFIDTCSNNSASNKVWVRANLVAKNTTTYTMYMYYGNASASSTSDSNTMSLYNGLEGYWTQNESSWNGTSGEVKDSSVNANNGTATGGVSTTTGKYGNGGNYDGSNDYANITSTTGLGVGDTFTLSAWIKRGVTSGSNVEHIIYGGTNAFALQVSTSNVIRVTKAGASQIATSVGTITDTTTFHHVVWTKNGATTKLYLDGVDTTGTVTDATISNPSVIDIGSATTAGSWFQGVIDDVRIYGRSLSQNEITALYSNPGSITTTATATSKPTTSFATEEKGTSPVAYWKFDDAQGQAANDSTTTAANGTLGATSGSSTDDPTWQTNDLCISGNCLYFDGGDYVNTIDSDRFSPTTVNDLSVGFWAKVPTATSAVGNGGCGGNGATPISKGSGSGYEWSFEFDNNATVCFNTWDSTGTTNLGTNTSMTVNDGNWHYYLATVNYTGIGATTLNLYIDGVRKNGGSGGATTMSNTSTTLQIGRRGDVGSTFFTGFIDEPKVYNQVLTAAQVQANYNARSNLEGVAVQVGNSTQSSSALNNGLAGYWKMDESSWATNCSTQSVLDSSGNGITGAACPNASAATVASGKFGKAGSFDGTNDYVNVTDNAVFDTVPTGKYTWSMWINPTNFNEWNAQWFQGNSSSDEFAVVAHTSTNGQWGPVTAGIAAGFSTIGGGSVVMRTNDSVLTASTWAHVVVTYDGTQTVDANKLSIYVNGVDQTARSDTDGITSSIASLSPSKIYIGYEDVAGENAQGKIDEMRYYTRALSANDVKNLYNWAPGPVGYWKLDEPSGASSAIDSSGYGNNGTITGTSYVANGKVGSARGNTQSSSDNISAGSAVSLDDLPQNTGMTVSFWVWAKSLNTMTLIAKKNGSSNGWSITCGNSCTTVQFSQDYSTTDMTANIGSNFGVNNWTYLTVTTTGTTTASATQIYFNGQLQAQTNSTNGSGTIQSDAARNLKLLNDDAGTTNGCDCQLDDVKVYNYVRTQQQIIEDMNGGHPPPGSPVGSPLINAKFNDLNGTTANNSGSAGSSFNGTMSNFASPATAASGWATDGYRGGSLSFDGSNDVVTYTNANPIDMDVGMNSYTWSAWINPTDAGEGSAGQVFQKGTNRYLRVDTLSGGKLDVEANADLATDANVNVSSAVQAGVWSHVAVTYDRPTKVLSVYINGVKKGNATGVGADAADTANLLVGGTTTANFNGRIDEVHIFTNALSPDQIMLDMNGSSAQVLGTLSQGVADSGTATAATSTTLSDSGKAWTTNQWANYKMTITAGTGAGQSRIISSNTSTQLTTLSAWGTTPDTTSKYTIAQANSNSSLSEYCVPGDSSMCIGPTLRLDMEEEYNTEKDTSGFNRSCSNLSDNPPAIGKIGKGTLLNNNSDLDCGAGSTYLSTTLGTLEIWVKFTQAGQTETSAGNPNTTEGIIGENNGNWGIARGVSSGNDRIWFFNEDSGGIDSFGTPYSLNTWYHLVWVHSGGNLYGYVNGTLVGSVASGTTISFGSNFRVGSNLSNNGLRGYADQVRIYNYARTPAQIAWSYNRGGPTAWWKFDECQGTVANDSSGNNQLGTITIGGTGTYTTPGTCSVSSASSAWYNGVTGKRNYSLSFDGTDDIVTVSGLSSTFFTGSWTQALWLKTTQAGNKVVTEKGSNQAFIQTNDGQIRVGTTQTAGDNMDTTGSPLVTDGNWHHVVITYNATTNSLNAYIDGVRRGSMTTTNDVSSSGTAYAIGSRVGIAAPFAGQIDDLQLYNYDLNPTQVKTLFVNGAATFAPATGAP